MGWIGKMKPTRWHGLVVLAAAPIAIGTVLLQLMAPIDTPVRIADIVASSGQRYLPGLVTLIAVLTIHVCVCLVGIVLAVLTARSRREDRTLLLFAIAAATAIVLGLLVGRSPEIEAYRLSYFFFRDLYQGHSGLMRAGTLELAMLLPTVLGIYGVATLTAASGALLRAIPPPPSLPDRQHELLLRRVHGRLKRFLYILAVGLVASTLAVSIFFGLPGNLPMCRASGAAAGVVAACTSLKDFAGEMSTYWGAVLSLALFACGGVPLLMLQHRVRCYLETSLDHEPVDEAEKRLTETGLLSDGGEQVKVALTVLAPLASGPVAGTVAGLANSGF